MRRLTLAARSRIPPCDWPGFRDRPQTWAAYVRWLTRLERQHRLEAYCAQVLANPDLALVEVGPRGVSVEDRPYAFRGASKPKRSAS